MNKRERIASREGDPVTRYRLEEAVRHVEVGVGEWASGEETSADVTSLLDRD